MAERVNGLMKTGLGAVSHLPSATAFGAIFEVGMPTEAKNAISNGVQGLNEDITNF